MDIYVEKEDKRIERNYNGKVRILLEELKINPETVIVVKEGSLVTDNDILNNSDSVKILSIISGG